MDRHSGRLREVDARRVGEEERGDRSGCAAADFHVQGRDWGILLFIKNQGRRYRVGEKDLDCKHVAVHLRAWFDVPLSSLIFFFCKSILYS